MSEQTLRARPRLLLIAVALMVVVAALFVIRREPLIAWPCIAFFGLGALVEISQTTLGGSRLDLDAQGFTIVNLWRPRRFRWNDVSAFTLFTMPRRVEPMVVFESPSISGSLSAANRALTGRAGYLPNNCGLRAAALAQLLNDRRDAALANEAGFNPQRE